MEIGFIHMQMLVHLHGNKTNFHMKDLKQRRKATQKLPIGLVRFKWLSLLYYHYALGHETFWLAKLLDQIVWQRVHVSIVSWCSLISDGSRSSASRLKSGYSWWLFETYDKVMWKHLGHLKCSRTTLIHLEVNAKCFRLNILIGKSKLTFYCPRVPQLSINCS